MESWNNMVEHYFSAKQTTPYTEITVEAILRNRQFHFLSAPGVFSKKKIDLGTALLINKCRMEDEWHVLDLGCGYGAVGVSLGILFPSCTFLCSDINERAVTVARKNVKKYQLRNVKVRKGDGFAKIKETFDTILLNPPQTAGKKVCERLIQESFVHVKKEGVFQMVARHTKGGKSLSVYIEKVFGNVDVLARGSGYRIYVATKTV